MKSLQIFGFVDIATPDDRMPKKLKEVVNEVIEKNYDYVEQSDTDNNISNSKILRNTFM